MQEFEYVFGMHAVSTLLKRRPKEIARLLVVRGRRDPRMQEVLRLAQEKHVHWEEAAKDELDRLVEGVHQGIVACCEMTPEKGEEDLVDLLDAIEGPPFVLVLDGVTDPHNLGACLRTADAAGVHLVIVPKDKSAPLNATARKVASGAAEAVPVVRVTNLARTLRELQERNIWLVGTSGDAPATLYEIDLTGPIALVMGAEEKGMRRLTREHCDYLAHLPMHGEVSSLNVSVATGICLFEAVRQRLGARRR